MIEKRSLIVGVGALCLLTAARIQAQELLVNGGFENEPESSNLSSPPQEGGFLWLSGNQIPGWTIVPGHMVTMHENPGPWATISGSYSVNTDGEGFNGHNADFYQDFSTVAGSKYHLAYDWEVWQQRAPGTALEISVADLTTHSVLYNGLFAYNSASPLAVQHVSTGLVGDGDVYRLEIQESPESGFNDNQFVVDNFSVTGPASAPDGGLTIAMLGMGISGLTLIRRKLQAGA